nr:SCP2 sterol-binding domain-containing protein [Candidatus Freyarchaeota archaeon]
MSKPKAAKAKKPKAAVEEKKPKVAVEAKPKVAVGAMDLKSEVEAMFKMPDKELMDKLPSFAPKVKGKAPELLAAMPDLPQKLAQRLTKSDVKKWSTEAPKASDAFTEFLWAVTGAMVERDPELKKAVTGAGDIKVNYEATDSPMKGHYHISGGKITGGPGLMTPTDLKLSSDTDTLIKLTTGALDATQAFMAGKYKMDGNLATAMKMAPVMAKIAAIYKGK